MVHNVLESTLCLWCYSLLWVDLAQVGCQIILMETPVSTFFLVESQTWQEWLFALAVGLGALPLALLTKLAARYPPNLSCNLS